MAVMDIKKYLVLIKSLIPAEQKFLNLVKVLHFSVNLIFFCTKMELKLMYDFPVEPICYRLIYQCTESISNMLPFSSSIMTFGYFF